MAVLSTFVISEDSKQTPNQNGKGSSLHILNPQNVLRPMFIPGAFSFSVTFGLIEVEPDKPHTVAFEIVSVESKTKIAGIEKIDIPANLPRDTNLPASTHGIMMNFDVRNVPFREQGKYEACIYFDGELLEKKPFFVFEQAGSK